MPSRKVERKNRKSRKVERKSRKVERKNRKQNGGNPMAQSLAQGEQFAKHMAQHGGAYLTGAPLSEISGSMLAPELRSFARVEGLDASIAAASHQRDPDQMPAQKGGKRTRKNRKSGRKNRKSSRKNRKSERKSERKPERKNRKSERKSERKNRKSERKNRKSERKNRKSERKNRKSERKNRKSSQEGGSLAGAPINQPSMLLSSAAAAKAGTADFSNPLLKH